MSEPIALFSVGGGLLAPSLLDGLRKPGSKDELARADGFASAGQSPLRPRELEDEIRLRLEELAGRWDRYREGLDEMDTSRIRELLLRPLLQGLGFEPQFRRTLTVDDARFAVSHQGWDDSGAPPVLLVTVDLDAKPDGGGRSPHEELQAFLNASGGHRWGLLANGTTVRVLRDFHHRRTRGYGQFDLDAILTARSYSDFLCLYRVCHASRFRRDDGDDELLESLYRRSLDAGVAIGRRLQPQVKHALEVIANGIATPALLARLERPEDARAFHRELLVLLYRLFFLLFAEQRGLLPAKGVYAESYSVSRLRDLAEGGAAAVEPRGADLWEGLKVSFKALSGEDARLIGAFPFNGPLFEEGRTPTLAGSRCDNRTLLRAIRAMTTVEIEGVRQHVNYAELGVEEIGSVYEALLDYVPVAMAGRIELRDTSETRSDFGAYYTPPALVDLVLSKSLDWVIAERLEGAGDDRLARERALLEVKVLDPACGSAAFLVGAIDRLAERLAEVRASGAASDHELRRARRDVLAHCIYAVDKDETAVELAKVALWIHCAVEDRPLTFLDHRIQHGDSLVGWPLLGRMSKAIPDEAFNETSKDTKEAKGIRKAWKERNREAMRPRLGEDPPPAPDPHLDPPPLDEAPETSPDEVHAKAMAYDAYREREDVRRLERSANLWVAAFLWSPEAGDAPTSLEYWSSLAGNSSPGPMGEEVERLAVELPIFHWALRFPEIRERGGFDCVVGNPPWEQYKVIEREWFASRAPNIAALPSAQRAEAISQLSDVNPSLHTSWLRHQVSVDRLAEFARHSGRYTPSGSEANTYLLFAELIADLLRPSGRAGVLLKSQLALDKSAQGVFQRLTSGGRVVELHDIVNGGPTGTNPVFPNVDAKERFSVFIFRGGSSKDQAFDATMMSWNVDEAARRISRRFTSEMLARLNPQTNSLTSFRHNEELEVALDIHSRLGTLDFEKGGENPWGIAYVTLFHSAGAAKKGLFHRREDLESEGWELGLNKIFTRGEEVALPLYEGQLANRYDHRAKTYEGFEGGNKYGRAPGIPKTTDEQKADLGFEIEPRYWVMAPDVSRRLEQKVQDRAMIGFRNVGAPWRNQRTVKGAVIPRYGSTHVLPELVLDHRRVFEFAAVFNSTVFDFVVRGKMPTSVVGLLWMLSQVAAPAPGLDHRIAGNARTLSVTSHSVAEQFHAEPHCWDPDERYRLDIQIDALVAIEYGLDSGAYAVVLDSFEVMRRMQAAELGRYKLKEDCLAEFDRLRTEPVDRPAKEITLGPA